MQTLNRKCARLLYIKGVCYGEAEGARLGGELRQLLGEAEGAGLRVAKVAKKV
jgi:hypothetical protein